MAQFAITGQVNVDNVPVLLIDPQQQCCCVKITNLTTVDIYIGFGNSIGTNTGDLLVGQVGAFLVIETDQQIWAIGSAAGGKISFIELR